jgi:hypothetical protein
MEGSVIVLSVVVLLFAVASAVLGFMAEASKLTVSKLSHGIILPFTVLLSKNRIMLTVVAAG